MEKQSDYVRVTLRLPPTLHAALVKSAEYQSLNAEIIERLNNSFTYEEERFKIQGVLPPDNSPIPNQSQYIEQIANIIQQETRKNIIDVLNGSGLLQEIRAYLREEERKKLKKE